MSRVGATKKFPSPLTSPTSAACAGESGITLCFTWRSSRPHDKLREAIQAFKDWIAWSLSLLAMTKPMLGAPELCSESATIRICAAPAVFDGN
jgi:hypothetical protein